MNVDPAASMRCWAIELEVGGRTFEVPPLPAADWWPVLVAGDPSLILDFLKSDPTNEDSLDEMLLSGELDGAELSQALIDAIEEMAGRSFHCAFVLATVAVQSWPIVGGALAGRGFRWDVMPLGAALDAIYPLILSNIPKEEDRKKFLRLLDNETLTGGKSRARDKQAVVTEFETLAGPKPTGGRKATGAPSDSARPRTRTRPRPPRQDGL